jgi:hypothetical protein
MDLKDFETKYWWGLLGAAGALISIASAPKPFVPGFVIGLGLLFLGTGEWINRPTRTEITRGEIVGSYIKTESNPWRAKPHGIAFDVLGVVGLAVGFYLLYRFVAFPP